MKKAGYKNWIPATHLTKLSLGRLLILSSFSEKENRITAERATRRNTFIAAIADTIFIAYAEPKGKTEQFCRDILIGGKTIYTVDSKANNNLISMGVEINSGE